MKRKTELTLIVGVNGTGKSTFIANTILQPGKKGLVVTPDGAEWRQLPLITEEQVRTLNGQARIIYEGPQTLEAIKNNYFGGVLVLDDAMAYLNEQTPAMLQYLYIRRRQFGIDLYLVAHGLRQIPPKCFTFCSYIILFNTVENFASRKRDVYPELFEKIIKTQEAIKKKVEAGDPYHYKILLIDEQIRTLWKQSKEKK
jgi:ABC-type sugar transport system ATPase subunit